MSACDEILELLSARLDSELTAEEETTLAYHLADCPQCRALADDFSAIHAILPDMNEVPPPAIKEAVMARIGAQTAAPTPFPQRKTPARRWQAWGAAAAIFLVVAAGAFALEHGAGLTGGGATMRSQNPSSVPSAALMPSPEGAPAATQPAALESADTGEAQPEERADVRATEKTAVAGDAPDGAQLPSAGLQPFAAMTALPPSPEDAARRLCDEVLGGDVQYGTWTEGEDLTGCLLPGGGWSLTYLGMSEDGTAYEFRVYVGDEEGRVYAVPLDGGEIQPLEQETK